MEDTDWETAVAPGQCRQLRVLGISAPDVLLGICCFGWALSTRVDTRQSTWLFYIILILSQTWQRCSRTMLIRQDRDETEEIIDEARFCGFLDARPIGMVSKFIRLVQHCLSVIMGCQPSNTTRVGCSKQQGIHSCFLTYSSHLSKTGKVALRFILTSKRALSDIFRRCATRFSPRRSCSTYRGESCGCRFQVPTVAFVDVSNADVSCRLFLLLQIWWMVFFQNPINKPFHSLWGMASSSTRSFGTRHRIFAEPDPACIKSVAGNLNLL